MSKNLFTALCLICVVNVTKAQNLNLLWSTDSTLRTPESVFHDEKTGKIYVANIEGKGAWDKDGKGSISIITASGKILSPYWVTGLHAPKGMGMFQDFLIVADVDSVVIIEPTRAQIVKKIYIEGAQALNDLTVDKRGNIYVSDSKTKKIHVIDGLKLDVSLYVDGLKGPNGVLFADRTLYYVDAGGFYKVVGKDKQKVLIVDGLEGGTDGIEQIDEENFLISGWSGTIYHVNLKGEKKLLLDTRGQQLSAADLGYDKKRKIVYVPTFYRNTVMAYELKY
jgi:DNA-binding beta-propeller fold protein YncE